MDVQTGVRPDDDESDLVAALQMLSRHLHLRDRSTFAIEQFATSVARKLPGEIRLRTADPSVKGSVAEAWYATAGWQ